VATARPIRKENCRLTLKFLGEVDTTLTARLEQTEFTELPAPFSLHLNLAGCWSRSGVAWLAPREPPGTLLRLQAAIDHLRGMPIDNLAYFPHLTIARRFTGERALVGEQPRISWEITTFHLLESRLGGGGVRYFSRRCWSLPAAIPD
jgi:2'-5' RNA ligase